MELPAHEVIFIFSTFLTGFFQSSFFNSFQYEIFIFNPDDKWLSSDFRL